MAQPSVFLSHSSKDDEFTRRLEADLIAAGATVHTISAQDGGDFVKRINDALATCQWVVLVLTQDALASPWVEAEVNAALRLARQGSITNILPIQAGPVDHAKLPPLLGNYNIFDATRDYASAKGGLLHTMGLALPATLTPPAQPTPQPSQPESEYEFVTTKPSGDNFKEEVAAVIQNQRIYSPQRAFPNVENGVS